MQQIGLFLPELDKVNKSRINNERASIIAQFVEEINKERFPYKKYKELSPRAVAVKVGHLKDNHTLYYFLSQCNKGKAERGSFSKVFFGALKVR